MDLGGIGNKIIAPIEKNAELIGAGLAVLNELQTKSLQDSLARLISGNVHAPNFTTIMQQLRADTAYQNSILAIIGGYLAQESGVGIVNKVGKIAVNAGISYFVARLAMLVLAASTHSDGGSSGGSPQSSGYGY